MDDGRGWLIRCWLPVGWLHACSFFSSTTLKFPADSFLASGNGRLSAQAPPHRWPWFRAWLDMSVLVFLGYEGYISYKSVKEAQEWGNEMAEYLGFMSEVLRKVSVAFFLSLQFVFSNTFIILLLMTVIMPILLCD